MSNADRLWEVVNEKWPSDITWLTIEDVEKLAPLGTAGITIPRSYEYAMLSMLSPWSRNDYLVHDCVDTQRVIDSEIKNVNRNNRIWMGYLNSKVRRATPLNSKIITKNNSEETVPPANYAEIDEVLEDDDAPQFPETLLEETNQSLSPLAFKMLEKFVEDMQNDVPWDSRLAKYDWKRRDYFQTENDLSDLIREGSVLSRLLIANQEWTQQDQIRAVRWAERIFQWGGTQQRHPITAANIQATLSNSISNRIVKPDAPMNSGYTKVASFGTVFLEDSLERHPQVINDSRVAASLLSRLDTILEARNLNPCEVFPGLGRVDAARGGVRRQLKLAWPNAYRSWQGQFAATQAVLSIRRILNSNNVYPRMPNSEGGTIDWTMRGIEAVLFMDGY